MTGEDSAARPGLSGDELRDRLRAADSEALANLVLYLTDRSEEVERLVRLWALEGGEAPVVDSEDIRERASEAVGFRLGPFGELVNRDEEDMHRDAAAIFREGNDYFEAGYYDAARQVYAALLEVLEDRKGQLNPHADWHRNLKWRAEERLADCRYELDEG